MLLDVSDLAKLADTKGLIIIALYCFRPLILVEGA